MVDPDPNSAACDEDNDGLTKGQEDVIGTNATNPDTDDDGYCDGPDTVEGVCSGGDDFPLDAGAHKDTDGDGMPDNLTGPSTSEPALVEDMDDDGDGLDADGAAVNGYDTFGVGAYYSPDSIPATISVAYDTQDPETGSDETDFFIGVDYEVGPGTLSAAYRTASVDDDSDNTDQAGYEVSYSYAINDSVTVTPGIFSIEENDGTNDDSGVVLETSFSF